MKVRCMHCNSIGSNTAVCNNCGATRNVLVTENSRLVDLVAAVHRTGKPSAWIISRTTDVLSNVVPELQDSYVLMENSNLNSEEPPALTVIGYYVVDESETVTPVTPEQYEAWTTK